MSIYSLSHVADPDLARELASLAAQDRSTTAAFLARIAEFDGRRLYLPAGFPSMYSYCVHELRLSEDSACKRIKAARTARQFPAIFDAVADGRLHLTAVNLLAPYLTPENANGLLEAAGHKTKAETEQLLAERFPRSEILTLVQGVPASPPRPQNQLQPGQVETRASEGGESTNAPAPERVEAAPRPKVAPLAPGRFEVRFTMGQRMQDKFQYAQALLGHQMPSGDIVQVLERGLDSLIREQERRKFAATSRPRPNRRQARGRRYVPAHVKRAVWKRDEGRCTFVSTTGQRCPARTMLEYDHVDPVALGGKATVEGIRLRCRAHNQYAAECAFGTDFMRNKREGARRARAEVRAAAAKQAEELDVVPWLRQLGFRADEARRAATHCDDTVPDSTIEERLRAALHFLSPPARRWSPAPNGLAPAP